MDALCYWIVIATRVTEWNRGRWLVEWLIGRAAQHVAKTI